MGQQIDGAKEAALVALLAEAYALGFLDAQGQLYFGQDYRLDLLLMQAREQAQAQHKLQLPDGDGAATS